MSERKNGQLPRPRRRVRNRISSDVWEQTKTAYASGIGLREIARSMKIPEGTVLARAKREQWTQQVQSARALVKRDGTPSAITPMEAVAITLNERKDKTKLHLSRYAVEASEKAANHRQKLKIARQVKDVAAVAGSVWPAEKQEGRACWSTLRYLGLIPARLRSGTLTAKGDCARCGRLM